MSEDHNTGLTPLARFLSRVVLLAASTAAMIKLSESREYPALTLLCLVIALLSVAWLIKYAVVAMDGQDNDED